MRTAGAISGLPLSGTIGDWGFAIDGAPATAPGTQLHPADWEAATPGYSRQCASRCVRGQILRSRPTRLTTSCFDQRSDRQANLEHTDPLGRRIELGGSADSVWRTIVGIAGNVKHGGLDKDSRTTMYIPYAQFLATVADYLGAIPRVLSIVVRTAGDLALADSVREIVRQVDPNVPLARIRALDDVVATWFLRHGWQRSCSYRSARFALARRARRVRRDVRW